MPTVGDKQLLTSGVSNQSAGFAALFLMLGRVFVTLAAPLWLARGPLHTFVHDLHIGRLEEAKFFFFGSLSYWFAPFAAILTDSFPLFKTRRRSYLLLGSGCAILSWIVLGFATKTYASLLSGVLLINLSLTLVATAFNGFLVDVGQAKRAVGLLTASRQAGFAAAGLIMIPLAGTVSRLSLTTACGIGVLCAIVFFVASLFLVKEERLLEKTASFANTGREIVKLLSSGTLWLIAAFILVSQLAPDLGMLQYERDESLHLLSTTGSVVAIVGAIAGLCSVLAYMFLARRLKLGKSLLIGILATAVASLTYLLYNSSSLAIGISILGGLAAGFAFTALMDLGGRGIPAGCESLGYSCLLTLPPIAMFGSAYVGAYLTDTCHLSWNTMVLIHTVVPLAALLLLPLLPKTLRSGKDSEIPVPS